MGLGQRIHGGLHGQSGRNGGLVRQPRLYEITTAISFGGRRRRIYDDLISLSGATTGDRVLDVGCGPGFLADRVAGVVGPTGRVHGIDPSPEVIAYANRTAPANTNFRVAAAEQLPYPDETFDVVSCTLALHHIQPDHRPAALQEMYRVLRTGGKLLIADFRPPRNPVVNRLVGALGGRAMQHNPIGQLPSLITKAGFRVTGQGDHRHWLRYIQATRQ
jgi:ubiquinone/menaquinone biosynthesis C-methylase UbiE